MLKTVPTTKPSGLLSNAFVAMRRLQTPTAASGTGRHRGRPASERRTAMTVPGTGVHRRPLDAAGNGATAAGN
ncbi:hypothetical protein PV392_26130 [Streptomyces sp. ME03-5709C]|nr:hypothetical protein [Streptomyces sp. ME03-5709C]